MTSSNGTLVTAAATTLIDSGGHTFHFTDATSGGNYNVARDGTVITAGGGTIMVMADGGTVYLIKVDGSTFVSSGATFTQKTSADPSGTTATAPNSHIWTAHLFSWGNASGSDYVILRNGVSTGLAASSMNFTSGVLTATKADSSQWKYVSNGWNIITAPAKRYYGDQAWSSSSVWNKGIGSGATWGLSTDADVIQLRTLTGALNAGQYSQPMYVGHSTDPLVTITTTNFGDFNVTATIRVPVNATPAAGADQHMNFIDVTQPGTIWSFYGCTFNNGQDVTGGITALLGGAFDATGDGLGNSADGQDNDFWAGTITEYDINQGAINHMTRIALSYDASHSPGSDWKTNIHWPNFHEDYDGPTLYTGSIDATATFGIPSSVNLASMGFTQGGLMLATAIQTYGSVWRDSGGTSQMTWYAVPTLESHPRIQEMRADMSKIMSVINVMRNQSTDNGATNVNGGGTYPTALPAVSTTR